MGRNEIKLRDKRLTPDSVKRYRNYSALLKKVERDKRYRQTLRIFIISIIVTIIVLLLIVASYTLVKWEREKEINKVNKKMSWNFKASLGHNLIPTL
jgi:cell division protein FtsL